MENKPDDIEKLSRNLNILISKHDVLSKEIAEIKSAIENYRKEKPPDIKKEEDKEKKEGRQEIEKASVPPGIESPEKSPIEPIRSSSGQININSKASIEKHRPTSFSFRLPETVRSNLEDFIGTNLINKIGIISS